MSTKFTRARRRRNRERATLGEHLRQHEETGIARKPVGRHMATCHAKVSLGMQVARVPEVQALDKSQADEEDETAILAGTVAENSEIETCIPLPLPKPRERKSWLMDSGSEIDVVSKSDLPSVNATNARSSPKPVSLTTANGKTKAANVADVKIGVLEDTFSPYTISSMSRPWSCH